MWCNGQPFGGGNDVDLGGQVGSVRRRLARRSLKPQLNQIRTWVRQGRTDAWIAHQLDASVGDIRSFKREHELAPEATEGEAFVPGAEAEDEEAVEDEEKPRRARRTRGGRGRRRAGGRPLEGTFDHGEEGYGLWLDPAVQDDATYAEHWAGHRPVTVTIEPDRIVISRAGDDAGDSGEDD